MSNDEIATDNIQVELPKASDLEALEQDLLKVDEGQPVEKTSEGTKVLASLQPTFSQVDNQKQNNSVKTPEEPAIVIQPGPKLEMSHRDAIKEVQRIEGLLQVKTKALYSKNKTELAIILEQRKTQLEDFNKPQTTFSEKVGQKDSPPTGLTSDDIFSQVKTPIDVPTKIDQDPVESKPEDNVVPPVVHAKKPKGKGKKSQPVEDPMDKANAAMLFRMNLLFLYSVETISEKYADRLNTSFSGVSKKMASDYDKDEYLQGVYTRIYRENKETIQQYASPLSELALYNATLLGTHATTNLNQTIKKKD
jgi:hypothetical protein